MEILTKSAEETKSLGAKVAASLKPKKNRATIVSLTGNLGSGKTTFSQGFALGLGVNARIISPTFILMRSYKIEGRGFATLYHLDLYRLEDSVEKEVSNLGFAEIAKNPKNLILIEWAEKIKEGLKDSTWIEFQQKTENERLVIIEDEQ